MELLPESIRLSRRRLLQVGGLGTALSLPTLLAARAQAAAEHLPRADACIVLFLNGGPSHLDMWDMKPDAARRSAASSSRSTRRSRALQVCEHLPRLARQMHRATVIRSLHHTVNNSHAAAVYCALTGHDRGEIGGGARPR